MSDNIKLVIEIPKPMYESVLNGTYCGTLYKELKNGTPLDDVKAEMFKAYKYVNMYYCDDSVSFFASRVISILDNIGKADMKGDKE